MSRRRGKPSKARLVIQYIRVLPQLKLPPNWKKIAKVVKWLTFCDFQSTSLDPSFSVYCLMMMMMPTISEAIGIRQQQTYFRFLIIALEGFVGIAPVAQAGLLRLLLVLLRRWESDRDVTVEIRDLLPAIIISGDIQRSRACELRERVILDNAALLF